MAASEHLSPDQFKNPMGEVGGHKIGWMSTTLAYRHRQYDSSTPGWKDRGGEGSYDALKEDIAKNGIREPLGLAYDPDTHRAMFGEGNHRLAAAKELGHAAVPVYVRPASGYELDQMESMKGLGNVKTPQKLFSKPGDNTRPSDVFGDDYRADPRLMKIGRELHRKAEDGD